MKRLPPSIVPFVVLCVITLTATHPLFDSRPIDGHDPGFNMIRLKEVHTLMTHGTIIPRWAPDLVHGYGYPLFIFYPPLSYIIAQPLHAMGFGLDTALKCVYVAGFLFAAFFMYLTAMAMGSPYAGLIGAALYTLAPYRLADVYVRVSYTEFLAMSLFPCILWAFLRFAQTDKRRFALAALAGLASLNLIHSISALLFYPVSFVWALAAGIALRKPLKRYFSATLILYLCATGITAFFWIPALMERQFVRIDSMISGAFSFENHFVTLARLFSFKWGYAASRTGLPQEMSFQAGWPQIIAVLLCAGCIYHALRKMRIMMIFTLTAIIASVFCMLPASLWIWKMIPLLAYLQFPWRILMLTALLASIAGLYAVVHIEKRYPANRWVWRACIAGICLYAIPYTNAYYIDEPLFAQTITHNTQQLPLPYGSSTLLMEYLPRWVKTIPDQPAGRLFTATDGIHIDNQVKSPLEYRCTVRVMKPGTLRASTFYYPGWRCYINGIRTKIRPATRTGIMEITMDTPGTYKVKIAFENTRLRRYANWTSLLFCIVSALTIWRVTPQPHSDQAF